MPHDLDGHHVLRLFLPILLWAFTGTAVATTRRAVVVGINHYQVTAQAKRATDLDGAVNDAEAIADTLRTFYGFLDKDIVLLRDQEATRERILQAIDQQLISTAAPGDISLFFYAGHGSYVENLASTERDHRDETIVPADSNLGAADIRDKELSGRFNKVIDKQAQLIAIFDSCHSGSISRWGPAGSKVRSAPPAVGGSRVVNIPTPTTAPEERGGLILSAAIDQQLAQEKRIRGQPRGRFTSALEHVLRGPYRDESVDQIFLRVRALMQSGGSAQEPVLAATRSRRLQTLWGTPVADRDANRVTVPVLRVSGTHILLQGGYAIGLGAQAELVTQEGGQATRLRILEVTGLSASTAEVIVGSITDVKPGDLFYVASYGIPWVDELRVFVPADTPSQTQWTASLAALRKLANAQNVMWVTDPSESKPTHVISWSNGQWVLTHTDGQSWPLGTKIKSAPLLARLSKWTSPRVFVSMPIPAGTRPPLATALGDARSFIKLTDDAADSDYGLVGRLSMPSGGVDLAWIIPNVQAGSRPGALPARGPWTSVSETALTELLVQDARRLARIKAWQLIESPAEESQFPYRLAVQEMASAQLLPADAPLQSGHDYQLMLVSDVIPKRVKSRYVYIFNIDREGNSNLLVPTSGAGNVENLVPDLRDRNKPPPQRIPIGPGFKVSPPYGRDTVVMVTSVTAIADPDVFSFSTGRRGTTAAPSAGDALAQFLFGLNTDTRASRPVPASWSIQRVVMESVGP